MFIRLCKMRKSSKLSLYMLIIQHTHTLAPKKICEINFYHCAIKTKNVLLFPELWDVVGFNLSVYFQIDAVWHLESGQWFFHWVIKNKALGKEISHCTRIRKRKHLILKVNYSKNSWWLSDSLSRLVQSKLSNTIKCLRKTLRVLLVRVTDFFRV